MKLDLYQVDAFTDKIFEGNPACVVQLQSWLDDTVMLKIARENAVAETAFFVDAGDKVQLRWFTPEIEMDLCGHATLATAHCLKTILAYAKEEITFSTVSGDLRVTERDGLYVLDFPSRMPTHAKMPELLSKALNIQPTEVMKSRDYVLVYQSEDDINNIRINRNYFDQLNLDPGGVIVTAKGSDCDFVSRFFTPGATVFEDPVTGSAHCSLIPYWSSRLQKKTTIARQLSDRGGTLVCAHNGDRVDIGGHARTYSIGQIWIEEP